MNEQNTAAHCTVDNLPIDANKLAAGKATPDSGTLCVHTLMYSHLMCSVANLTYNSFMPYFTQFQRI